MKIKFLLIPILGLIASCSTAYKSGQTPDDVYYSPQRVIVEDRNDDNDEVKNNDPEEREIRMATKDRRWRDFDGDYNKGYDPYRYGYDYGYYYNPYYCHNPVYINNYSIVNPKNNTPRRTSLGSYTKTTITTANNKYGNTTISSGPAYNNSNRSSSKDGGIFRGILGSGSSGSDNRSYSPSSSGSSKSSGSSSSGSSSSGSSRSVSRPSRGQ